MGVFIHIDYVVPMPSLLSLPLTVALPPLLLLISLPLAILAALTTYLAFATLTIRLSIVYVELGGALLRSWLFSPVSKTPPSKSPALHISTSNTSLAQQRRSRRNSTASHGSTEHLQAFRTPGYSYHHRNDSLASLLGAGAHGPARDYEGIGGWRDEDDDPDREALWLGMNKRLELPAAPPARRHRRSGTGSSHGSLIGGNASQIHIAGNAGAESTKRWSYGSGIWSPETLRMSPVQSRARTPSVTDRVVLSTQGQDDESYFAMSMPKIVNSGEVLVLKSSSKDMSRRKSVDVKETKRDRRKSSSGDSISSMGSKATVRKVGNS